MNFISILLEIYVFIDYEYIILDRESFKIMLISRLSFSLIIVYCFICIFYCGCFKDFFYIFVLYVFI